MSKTAAINPHAADDDDVHQTSHRDIRSGDTVRLVGEDGMDRLTAIAKWPWTQEDFSPGRHPEIPTETRFNSGEGESVKKQVGMRTSLATEDGRVYSVVDWSETDDPPYLYLLVINGEDPEQRRWDRVGKVQGVERYGPEPSYRMAAFKWCGTRENHLELLEHAADGAFQGTDADGELPTTHELRELAQIRAADEPQPLTRGQIATLNAVYQAAREYVSEERDPILTGDAKRDLNALDTTLTHHAMTALFPDGDGGWIEKPCEWTGPPSSEVEPWKRENRSGWVGSGP